MTQDFLLGVNYWPRRKAMYWWRDFDSDEVCEEFALIADLGMKIVRIFLLWDDWQPTPDTVSPTCLDNLGVVCDIAAEHGLGLDITFFTGHMSGPNWVPQWLLADDIPYPSPAVQQVVSGGKVVDRSYRNMYTDEVALAASRLLLKTVVSRYKDHPGVWMWNLGNEPNLFAVPPTPQAGQAWVREMVGLVKAIDPIHPVTCGLHVDNLSQETNFRVPDVYAEIDVAVMHGYPMYMSWARDALDADLVPYLCALVTAMSGKPTLMEEWGGCTAPNAGESQNWAWTAFGKPRTQFMASETDLADFIEQVLPKLVDVGATGSVFWCFADYAEELWDYPPCDAKGAKHERHFGLVRPDGSLKPHAEVIRRFAATQPKVNPNPPITMTLDISLGEYYTDPGKHLARLYKTYLEQLG